MKIKQYFGNREINGEVGIEIEMEGKHLAIMPDNSIWRMVGDGSLRGEAIEYILARPIDREKIEKTLHILWGQFTEQNSKLIPSDRCGVHIHLNCQDLEIDEVFKIIVLYLCLENLLVHWCGEDRVGNLFCLRSNDAEDFLLALIKDYKNKEMRTIVSEANYRYASVNCAALFKFGSLEFRALKTEKNYKNILIWIEALLAIKDKALQFNSVKDIIESISAAGEEQFVRNILGDKLFKTFKHPQLNEMVLDSVRNVQVLAYIKRKTTEPKKVNNA